MELTLKKNLKIADKTVLNGEVNTNFIENKDLSNLEYFYLGGNANLRGFTENQFAGYLLIWSKLELRYLLSRKSRTFLFLDHGFVKSNEYLYGMLFGFGLGLRIETRLGLLGIDYGLSYSEGVFRNPLDGIIHFGIETKL